MIKNLLFGGGGTVASHAGHVAGVVLAGTAVLFVLALLWRLSGHRASVTAPSGQSSSAAGPVIAAVLVVLAAGVAYDRIHPGGPAGAVRAAPTPTPTPSPSPSVSPSVRVITRVVNAHPMLSGWQVVVICVIAAIVILGGLSLARRLRG